MDRYRSASVAEFNEAARGYWRNWERHSAWVAREIVWELICGNPYYDAGKKPHNRTEVMKLTTDPKPEQIAKLKEMKRPTKAEMDEARKILMR